MTWRELCKAIKNIKTTWNYLIICYDDTIEVGIGKVEFIFTKELDWFQEFTFYTDDDYEQHKSSYCGKLKDYKQMLKLIKQLNNACITLYQWKE